MLFYVIMTFVVLAIAGIVCWALNDPEGWMHDEDEIKEWKEDNDDRLN